MASFVVSSIVVIILLVFKTHSTCASRLIKVSTPDQLHRALEDAAPGDNISLSGNTTFPGTFIATKNGSRAFPITIFTQDSDQDKTFNAKLVGEISNAGNLSLAVPVLTITGDYYDLKNITILHNNNPLALLIEGTAVSLYGVMIKHAVTALRVKGARVYLKDCYISEITSGGIQMEGDFGIVRDTFVTGTGILSVVADKQTCCGTLVGNVFDGKVDIKGTDFNLFDNLIEGKSQ